MVNGIDDLAVTNIDGLDTVETIKVCIGYRDGAKRYDYVPNDIEAAVALRAGLRRVPRLANADAPTRASGRICRPRRRSYLKAIAELTRREAGHRVGRPGAGADDSCV